MTQPITDFAAWIQQAYPGKYTPEQAQAAADLVARLGNTTYAAHLPQDIRDAYLARLSREGQR